MSELATSIGNELSHSCKCLETLSRLLQLGLQSCDEARPALRAGTVYVKRKAIEAISGRIERSNVFWKQPDRDPVNVSRCELATCGQPSASSDGSKIAFVKAYRKSANHVRGF